MYKNIHYWETVFLLQTTNKLHDRLVAVEERLSVVETLVSCSYTQQEQNTTNKDQLLPLIENLSAKVTLMDHRLMLAEKDLQDLVKILSYYLQLNPGKFFSLKIPEEF